MIIPLLVFYLLSAVAVAAGVMVISARNPVHSVLFLILAFFNSAGLFVLIGADVSWRWFWSSSRAARSRFCSCSW